MDDTFPPGGTKLGVLALLILKGREHAYAVALDDENKIYNH